MMTSKTLPRQDTETAGFPKEPKLAAEPTPVTESKTGVEPKLAAEPKPVTESKPAAEPGPVAEPKPIEEVSYKQAEMTADYATLMRDYIRSTPVVFASHTCEQVIAQFGRQPDCDCVVVCDEAHKPRGLVMKSRLTIIQTHRFGQELYYNRSIVKLMDAHPLVVDKSVSPQELLDRALGRDEKTLYDCVVVTEDGRFRGILTVADLLHMSRSMQMQSVQSQVRIVRGAEAMIGEIDRSVEQAKDAARRGEEMSGAMVDLTLKGKKELDKATEAIANLADGSSEQQNQIAELQRRAGEIGSISKLIRELADQSNLLAVNATIEAARAGEHGRGFGVVANEVRQLASQTKQSADRINAMIRSILGAVSRTVELVEAGRENTLSSRSNVQAAFELFEQLFHAAADNSGSAREIGDLTERTYNRTAQVLGEMKRLAGELQSGR